MDETIITCPQCSTEIPISEALGTQIRRQIESTLRTESEERLRKAVDAAEARKQQELGIELKDLKAQLTEREHKAIEAEQAILDARKRARTLEEDNRKLAERIRAEVEETMRKEAEQKFKVERKRLEEQARKQAELEIDDLRKQLDEQSKQARKAHEAELEIRKKARELEAQRQNMELEIQRKLDEERGRIEANLRQRLEENQMLRLKEKEKQIEDLRKALEDAQRKSQQGSQETQGEVLELDIEATLAEHFPDDEIRPVPKGMRGADILQKVRTRNGQSCGTIIWETKNTKHWSPAWIDKLKEDQRTVGAAVAILVSVALPEEISGFGRIDGVWIASLRSYPALAMALREQLTQVAFARNAQVGKNEKMEMLYQYLAGDEFRHRVDAIVEAFTAMDEQLHGERRAMERHWKEREKQIQRVIGNTAGMYGAMRGIIGQTMPEIQALSLESEASLEDAAEG